jgi:outer membrane protein assembly factor BamB
VLAAICAAWCATAIVSAQTDGSPEWRAPLNGFAYDSSPAISPDGKTVYIGVQTSGGAGRLVALETATGRAAWPNSFNRALPFVSSPTVSPDGRTVYIGCDDGWVYARDAQTGARRWEVETGDVVSSSVVINGDTVYFGSADGVLYARDRESGAPRWSYNTRRSSSDRSSIYASPAVGADGTVYVGTVILDSASGGKLYAIAPDGTLRWELGAGNSIWSSPAIGTDGTIYVGSNDQRVYAVNADGTKRWEFVTNGVVDASPVLGADGTIYVASGDTNLYALDPRAPEGQREKWRVNLGITRAKTATVRSDGVILIGGDNNILRAIDPVTRAVRWEAKGVQGEQDEISGAVAIGADNAIFFGSSDGGLYKLQGTAPLSTYSNWPTFLRDSTRPGRADVRARAGRLVNLSTRASVQEPGKPLIVGFAVQATGARAHLLRAVGPTLADYGVLDFMPDPRLEMFAGTAPPMRLERGSNDDWESPTEALFLPNAVRDTTPEVGAFPLRSGSKDAALLALLTPGVYTAHASSSDGRGGVVLVEAYDVNAPEGVTARLVNLSTRFMVREGEGVLIAGFAVGGTERTRLLLRGVGPGLAQFGVSPALARPALSLYRASNQPTPTPLATNIGWTAGNLAADLEGAFADVSAFPLARSSADAAMIVTVEPGAYTLQVSGVNNTQGEALAEIYVLP